MPGRFFGVSEYDRNFRWVNSSLAATCAAPVAGKASATMQSATEPPIQRKSRTSTSPLRSSVVFDHPMSSERRSLAQDDFLLLGRNEKFESSLPYRNALQKAPRKEAWGSGEAKRRPRKVKRRNRESELSENSYQVTPDAPRNGALQSRATQTTPRHPPTRKQMATQYGAAFKPVASDSATACAAVVEANRLRNRGTHFSRRHFAQLLGEGAKAWLPTPDTPVAPWRREEEEEEEEEEEYEEEEEEEEEKEERRHPVSLLRVPPELAGRLPTPRAALFRRHHLDRTTPAVGGTLLTAPASHRSGGSSVKGRSRPERAAGQASEDPFAILDERGDKDRAVRFASDWTQVIPDSARSASFVSDRTMTSSRSSVRPQKASGVRRRR